MASAAALTAFSKILRRRDGERRRSEPAGTLRGLAPLHKRGARIAGLTGVDPVSL
jgi:hypothetical protein